MTRCRASRRSGRTLLDLIVVIALITFLAAAMLPGAVSSREVAKRVRCASNLRMIGQALLLYANENNGNFPRTKYDPKSDKINAYSGFAAKDPFAKDGGPEINDVTAPMFLLVRTQDIFPEVFVCPGTDAQPLDFGIKAAPKIVRQGPSTRPALPSTQPAAPPLPELAPGVAEQIQVHSNFPDNRNLSYSMHNPYFGDAAINAGARWTNTLRADFALAADMNPGGDALQTLNARSARKDLQKGNSANHGRDGQNVLYGDAHVEFQQTPFCGVDFDNIYTFGPSGNDKGGDGIIGSSTGPTDSVLLPTGDQGKPAGRKNANP